MVEDIHKAEKEAWRALQNPLYLSSAALKYVAEKRAKFKTLENMIKDVVVREGYEGCPSTSAFELENSAALFCDVIDIIVERISSVRDILVQKNPSGSFPSDYEIYSAVLRDDDLENFLTEYVLGKAEYQSQPSAQVETCFDDDFDKPDCESIDSDVYSRILFVDIPDGSLIAGADELKLNGVSNALAWFFDEREEVLEAVMGAFPSKARDEVFNSLNCELMEVIVDFSQGKYSSGLEHRYLSELESGCGGCKDDLYARLKKKKQLDNKDMQRVYLMRFAKQHRVCCLNNFNEKITAEYFWQHVSHADALSSRAARYDDEKMRFLKKCLQKHRVWIDGFLKS